MGSCSPKPKRVFQVAFAHVSEWNRWLGAELCLSAFLCGCLTTKGRQFSVSIRMVDTVELYYIGVCNWSAYCGFLAYGYCVLYDNRLCDYLISSDACPCSALVTSFQWISRDFESCVGHDQPPQFIEWTNNAMDAKGSISRIWIVLSQLLALGHHGPPS